MDLSLKPSAEYRSTCFELNNDLFNLMDALNYQSQEWGRILQLSAANSRFLSTDFEYKSRLFNSPVLCVEPLLVDMTQWDTLFTGDVQKLAASFSLAPVNLSATIQTEIKYQNKFYLNHLISTARTSPLAMLELGVSFEIIQLLRRVTVEQKNNAMLFRLPLFKWRYPAPFIESSSKQFSELEWIAFLIHSTPAKLSSLPAVSDLAKRYHSEAAYPLAEHLVRFGMRATIISTLLPNLHTAKIREMYKRLLSESSSCGKLPSSFTWYFVSERRRAHSSFFLLLYRLAQRSGLAHIHSIIAAYGWYVTLAPEEPMAIDRLGILVNTVQSGSGMMYVAACRSCTANYLLCNTDDKQEFAQYFHCSACQKKQPHAA